MEHLFNLHGANIARHQYMTSHHLTAGIPYLSRGIPTLVAQLHTLRHQYDAHCDINMTHSASSMMHNDAPYVRLHIFRLQFCLHLTAENVADFLIFSTFLTPK